MLVPNLRDVLSVDMQAIKWILVVEKEATFRSIAASPFWGEISTAGVLVTGKGYPDIATRAFVRFLSTASPHNGFKCPPVYCLVDFDPDGLAIVSVYKSGSMALSHENDSLRVPGLRWLGLRSEHMKLGDEDVHAAQGLLSLAARDRRKAVKMLERTDFSDEEGGESEIVLALQTMLMLNTKAELQLLDANANGMLHLLESTLSG